MRLMLLGGGGHCLSCIAAIEKCRMHSIIGVVERDGSLDNFAHGYPILGSDSALQELLPLTDEVLITVGQVSDAQPRRALYERLRDLGASFATISASDSSISSRASIGVGTVVLGGATVNAGAEIGVNCIVNSHALIEHGVRIDSHCHISTGALVNGDVVIGEGSFIGSGAVIREGVIIGARCVVGAGSRIGSDVASGTKVESDWSSWS